MSDRFLGIAPVTAHRFFVSYKWGHPKGNLTKVDEVDDAYHNAGNPDELPTAKLKLQKGM